MIIRCAEWPLRVVWLLLLSPVFVALLLYRDAGHARAVDVSVASTAGFAAGMGFIGVFLPLAVMLFCRGADALPGFRSGNVCCAFFLLPGIALWVGGIYLSLGLQGLEFY